MPAKGPTGREPGLSPAFRVGFPELRAIFRHCTPHQPVEGSVAVLSPPFPSLPGKQGTSQATGTSSPTSTCCRDLPAWGLGVQC